jgi:hypothetical protein
MGELLKLRAQGLQSRSFGRVYLQWRLATESRMHKLFLERGGEPLRTAPHYFVLGTSRWYAGLARDMRAVTLPLNLLPARHTSFTLVDSFTAMGLGPQFGLPHLPEPHQAQLYRCEELGDVIGRYGLPRDDAPPDDYAGYEREPVTQFVEVQLWCDGPLAALLE